MDKLVIMYRLGLAKDMLVLTLGLLLGAVLIQVLAGVSTMMALGLSSLTLHGYKVIKKIYEFINARKVFENLNFKVVSSADELEDALKEQEEKDENR